MTYDTNKWWISSQAKWSGGVTQIKTGGSSGNEEFLELINAKKHGVDAQEPLSNEAAN
jgi:hypothetical protein